MNSQWTYDSKETVETVQLKPLQTVVEADTALEGGLRDETRILYAGANAVIRSAELSGTRISVEGRVRFKVLYAQGDMKKIIPLEIAADFSQMIQSPTEMNERSDGDVQVICQVDDVDTKVHNGRIALTAIIGMSGYIRYRKPLRCVQITDNSERVRKKVCSVYNCKIVSRGEVQTTVRDELELSELLQINETLFANAYGIVEDVKPAGNQRIAVLGSVLVDAYHTSNMPQRPLITTQHKIPFEQEISLSDYDQRMISAQTQVQDIAVISQALDDDQGGKLMRCEVLLHSTVNALEREPVEILSDAYTLYGEDLDTVSQDTKWTQEYVCEECAESGRMTISLPENSPRIRQPLVAFMQPIVTQKRMNGNRLQLDGTMQSTIVYLTDDREEPVSVKQMSPFTAVFTTTASQDDHVSLHVTEPVLTAVTGDRAEVRYVLHLSAEGERNLMIPVVTDVSEVETKPAIRGISICYVQPGESVWDIAKHYRIQEDVIAQDNHLDEQGPPIGTPLIIHSIGRSADQELHT